mmetsp:Transcript_14742/g.19331  ORF Transcript_14742/g.19331 Transcript_14742/m.19331 type:complete len:249 (+) Transcript_14742:164-910(+)
MQLFHIPQLDIDHEPVKVWFPIHKFKVRDIGLFLADQCANASQHTCVIADGQFKRHPINGWVCPTVPVQIDPAFGLIFDFAQCVTVRCMNDHTAAPIGDADDPLSRQRLTALGTFKALPWLQTNHSATRRDLFAVISSQFWIDGLHDVMGGQNRGPKPRQQLINRTHTQRTRRCLQRLIRGLAADMLERGARQLVAQLDEPRPVRLTQGTADGRPRLTGGCDIQPAHLRCLPFCDDDIDRLTIAQPRP